MERKPPASIGDFVDVVKRRKYWIIVPFILVVALGIVLTPLVPRSYQSTTTIMVEPQKVPAVYVRPGATNDMVNRVHRIQMEIMTGPDLVRIIQDRNLYPELRKKYKMNRVVAMMARDITIAAAPDSTEENGTITAFTISYIGRTPQEAQQITKDLADLFIQENFKESHQQALGTAAFLGTQVAQAAQQLAAQQTKIQAFKDAHLGSLPEQAQANIQMIGEYQSDLQANSAAIDQDNQQRVYLQSVLNVNPNNSTGTGAVAAPSSPLQTELAQKQTELQADLLKYTPEHPDIIRLKHDIAALKIQIRQAPKSSGSAVSMPVPLTSGPSPTDQLRGQLIALNTEIKARKAHEQMVEQRLSQLQKSIATVPAVQTQYSGLDSQYQEMQKTYNVLVEKQQEATMATALYKNDDSEQFLVIQPANFPSAPFRPNPILLYMGAVLMGLLAGFVCAAAVELRDDTMHNADEAAAYLKLPVMVALPKCLTDSEATWTVSTAKS